LVVEKLACVRDGRVLFEQLDFELGAAEVVALQGANGAGKSTLLRCIADLYPDYEGSVSAAPLIYSGHKAGLCSQLSTAENLQFLVGLDASQETFKRSEASASASQSLLAAPIKSSVEEALAAVGLAGYEDVRCAALSAGQLRRVGLARLLTSRAPLWLLDEPLTALDQAGADLLGRVLARHAESGGSAICATHQDLPVSGCRRLELTPSGVASVAA
jgi:heme exporter protein A